MPVSAYSEMFQCELDVDQYLYRRNWRFDEITDAMRAEARKDVSCPSCGISLTIRKPAVNKNSKTDKAVATFSAVNSINSIESAHHPLCEYSLHEKSNSDSGSVDFMRARTESQKIVRLLVCKAIYHEIIFNKDIKDFRRWVFEQKTLMSPLLNNRSNNAFYEGEAFARSHTVASWKKLNTEGGSPSKFIYENLLLTLQSSSKFEKLIKNLEATLDPELLIDKYLKVTLLSKHYKTQKIHPGRNSHNHFEAFLAFILFINNWSITSSEGFIRRILALPDPEHCNFGNLNGINPFYNFDNYIFCKLAITENSDFIDHLNELDLHS